MKAVRDRYLKSGSSSSKGATPPQATPDRLVQEARQEIMSPLPVPATPPSTPQTGLAAAAPPTVVVTADEDTVRQSGNPQKKSSKSSTTGSSSKKKKKSEMTLEEQLEYAKDQIAQEKAGKRKLFHSLVKLANELRKTRTESTPLVEQKKYAERNWYEGGMWRAPEVLPGVVTGPIQRITRIREATSLSDLFFDLVVVTAFTRVGVAISEQGVMNLNSLLYYALFWTVWSKDASYSTRFDTTDLSARVVALVTCFAVLFASLSVHAPIASVDGTRIMMVGAFVALLHFLLHVRVALTTRGSDSPLHREVVRYAIFIIVVTFLEATVWVVGIVAFPEDWEYRYVFFIGALLFALRFPRAFLSNDFHAACAKRGVLFILLLGFLLQSVVVVASQFYEYQTPLLADYAFVGAACLMLYCIKLLYVDDSNVLTEDHALMVSSWSGFFFNVGQFCLLLSTTVMGSGLNLLTHSYLAATAALPGPEKALVCGGFAAVLLSTFFIKSMHLKRIPAGGRNHALFIAAYVVQSLVLFAVVGLTIAMCFGNTGGFLAYLMQNDIQLLFSLSGGALFVVLTSWLDEGVELTLYPSAEDSSTFRVYPWGFWCCLRPSLAQEEEGEAERDVDESDPSSGSGGLSALTPLLGGSMENLNAEMGSYDTMGKTEI